MTTSHNICLKSVATVKDRFGNIKDQITHIPGNIEGVLELEKINKAGIITERKSIPMRSVVRQLLDFLYIGMGEIGSSPLKRVNGATVNFGYSTSFSILSGNDSSYGLVIGTDDGSSTALAIDNYALGGHVTTDWSYGTPTITNATEVDGDAEWKIQRNFTNNTGGSVTIEEVGLYCKYSSYVMMLTRDLLGVDAVAVGDGETLAVTHKLKLGHESGLLTGMMKMIDNAFSNAGTNYTDVEGSTVGTHSAYEWRCFYIDSDNHVTGPVVGTDSTAVTLTDYALGSEIADGSGAGELDRDHTYDNAIAVNAGTVSFDVWRVFTNNSGGTITAKEAGIYTWGPWTDTTRRACVARHIINGATGIDVADTETLTMTFTFAAEI